MHICCVYLVLTVCVFPDGVNIHVKSGPGIWRIPFGFQLVPAGIMCFGLLFATESPRWLAQKGRNDEALKCLAHLRRLSPEHEAVRMEMAGECRRLVQSLLSAAFTGGEVTDP